MSITHREASVQAWRRLRKTMTASELAAIAQDIAKLVTDETEDGNIEIQESIAYALAAFPWEDKKQA